jgi:hypothetical protein
MLNASHSCMAYLMAIAGVTYVDEAMNLRPLHRFSSERGNLTPSKYPAIQPPYARTTSAVREHRYPDQIALLHRRDSQISELPDTDN